MDLECLMKLCLMIRQWREGSCIKLALSQAPGIQNPKTTGNAKRKEK